MTETLSSANSGYRQKSMRERTVEQAFDRFLPPFDGPADMPPTFQPTGGPASTADYSRADTCPYCRKPMVLTSVRTAAGVVEPVYLCREDRAVGVVPTEAAV